MQVTQLMTSNPHIINADATLFEAAQKMRSFDCGILPVGDDVNHVIGVITDRDIVTHAIANDKDGKTTPVKEVMTANPFFCAENETVQEAVRQMNEHHTRRILVKDKNNKLTGILSLGDIIRRVQDKMLLGELFAEVSVG